MTSKRKLVVVVAEDDPLLRLDACQTLQEAGFEVFDAPDAPSAFAECAKRDVDLLFTDIQMPGPYCGLDLAKRVHENWPDVVLFVTSGGMKVARDQMPDDGRFIPKPYEIDRVVHEMRAALLTA